MCDALEHHSKYEWIVALGAPSEDGSRITAVCGTVLNVDGTRFPSSIALVPGWPTSAIDAPIRDLARKVEKRVKELRRSGSLPPGKLLAVYGYFSAFDGLKAKNCNSKDCVPDVLIAPGQIQVSTIQDIP